MKTKFKYLTLIAIALLFGFSSCSNDDETGDRKGENTPKSLFLKISNGPATYAEGTPVTNGATVGFTSGELFFVNGSGAILDHYTISSAATSTTNINLSAVTTTGTVLSNLNGGISNVYIVGNVPASVTLPTSGNISVVKAKVLSLATQEDIAQVNLYGTAELIHQSDNDYKAEVTLNPTVARIELAGITAGGVITDFQVDGIFVDNYYAEGNIDGSISGSIIENGTTPATFIGDGTSTAYPTASKTITYDWNASGLGTMSSMVYAPSTVGEVWGYNLFAATTTGSAVPRIIIRLSNFTTNNGSTISDPQFVTIKGLKNGNTSLTKIEAGEVYSIAASSFVINEEIITPNPNQSTIDVEVKVTLAKWEVIDVTPEL